MLISIFKKIIGAVFSLCFILLLMFFLSKAVPGDPVDAALGINSDAEFSIDYNKEYAIKKKALYLDLPSFYFALLPPNFPRNINKAGTLDEIQEKRKVLIQEIGWHLPRFYWYGSENQFHQWLFSSKFSLTDGKSVWFKIKRSLVWTVFLVISSLVLSYSLGIILGIFLVNLKSKWLRRLLEISLFSLYAVPVFWMATLLMVFFTTKEYGSWTNIFPTVGLAPIDFGEPWFERIGKFGKQLILPTIVLVLHNLAFLSMLTRRNIDKHRKLGFVVTSRAYGFSRKEIMFKEVLPLSLLPLITSISSSIPAAISGSLVLEIIFNIPGMGRLLYTAILNLDWPLVFAVVLLLAIITYISFLLADIFYKIADPRIS